MSGFINIFGGSPINPSNVSFSSISLTGSNSPYELAWPVTGLQSSQLVTQQIEVTASVANLSIVMPDATQATVGQVALFYNIGVHEFNILDADQNVICNVPVADNTPPTPPTSGSVWIYLKDNSTTAGDWGVMSFGALTGEVQASLLAGYGLVVDAVNGNLDTNITVTTVPGPTYDVKPTTLLPTLSDRAKYIIWTGGSGTVNFPPVNLATAGFFFAVGNQTSNGAAITLATPDGALIDGENTQLLSLSQTSIYTTDGTDWYSLGLGTTTFFQTTVLVKDLSPYGGGTVTLTNSEASKTIASFVTNTSLLTSNITILYPATPGFYFITNNVTDNGFTVSIAANGGAIVTAVPVGETFIFYNDGSEMSPAPTSVAAGAIVFPDGSAASPSIRFLSDPSSGLYMPAVGEVGVSISSSETIKFDANGLVIYPTGTTLDPSLAFNSVASTGMYLNTVDQLIAFSYNNVDGMGVGSNFVGITNGTSATPSLGFLADDTTGIFRASAGVIGFTSAATEAALIDSLGIATVAGTSADPSYSFIADPNTGMYNPAANSVGFASDGNLKAVINTTSFELLDGTDLVLEEAGGVNTLTLQVGAMAGDFAYMLPTLYPTVDGQPLVSTTLGAMSWATSSFDANGIKVPDGAEATPSIAFTSDPTSGFYTIGGQINISISGNTVANFDPSGIAIYDGLSIGFFDSTRTFAVELNASTATADVNYTLPAVVPTVNGQPLVSTTLGVMSWATSSFDADGIKVPDGAEATPSIAFTAQTNTGFYHPLANQIRTSINGSDVFLISDIGTIIYSGLSLGFFDSTDNFTVSLSASTATADADYILPPAVPTANDQALVSTTGGTMSWKTVLPQVLQTNVVTQQTIAITANTFADVSGLSQAITPATTSSKVLVRVVMHVSAPNATVQDIFMRIQRNGVTIGVGTPSASQIACGSSVHSANNEGMSSLIYEYLDSPASVAAQTYQVQVSLDATDNFYLNRDVNDTGTSAYQTPISSITLTEVLA